MNPEVINLAGIQSMSIPQVEYVPLRLFPDNFEIFTYAWMARNASKLHFKLVG